MATLGKTSFGKGLYLMISGGLVSLEEVKDTDVNEIAEDDVENDQFYEDNYPDYLDDDETELSDLEEDYIDQVMQSIHDDEQSIAEMQTASGIDFSFLLEPDIKKIWQAPQSYTKVWPDIDLSIDPCQAAADNYLLFGIANNSFVEIIPRYYPTNEEIVEAGRLLEVDGDSIQARAEEIRLLSEADPTLELEKLNREADTLYRNLIDRLDVSFRQYAHLACGGEVRYMLKSDPHYPSNDRRWAWAAWWFVFEKYGIKSLETMIDLFRKNGYGAIGGEKWAVCADVLLSREAGTLGPDELTNKQLFIDRVFTLQHNTGSFLNKLSWSNNRAGRNPGGGHWREMKDTVLPAHCANPVDIKTMYNYASTNVQQLLIKYFDLALSHGLEINGVWEDEKPAIIVKTEIKNSSVETLDWNGVPDFEEEDVEEENIEEEDGGLPNLPMPKPGATDSHFLISSNLTDIKLTPSLSAIQNAKLDILSLVGLDKDAVSISNVGGVAVGTYSKDGTKVKVTYGESSQITFEEIYKAIAYGVMYGTTYTGK